MKIETGYMPFKGFKTFYRVVGEKTDRAPLVLLHGGPGSTHNYFEVLDPLAELTHRQIILTIRSVVAKAMSRDIRNCGHSAHGWRSSRAC